MFSENRWVSKQHQTSILESPAQFQGPPFRIFKSSSFLLFTTIKNKNSIDSNIDHQGSLGEGVFVLVCRIRNFGC